MNTENINPPNSIVGLLRDLKEEAATLVRQQIALAKAELKENVARLGGHVAQIAAGGVIALLGGIVLLIGIGHLLSVALVSAGLSEATAQWLGPTLVGLVVAVIGWVMLARAKKALADDPLAPRRTIETLKADQAWAQSKIHQSHESTT